MTKYVLVCIGFLSFNISKGEDCSGYLKAECTDCEMKRLECIARSNNVMNTDTKGKKELLEETQRSKTNGTPKGAGQLAPPQKGNVKTK